MKNSNKIEKRIWGIIKAYEYLVLGIEKKAKNNIKERAYGGIIRAGKGELVESITKELLNMAWIDGLGNNPKRLEITRNWIKIPLRKEYIEKIKNSEVKESIRKNIDKYFYPLQPDWQVFIDKNLKLVLECKSYTENAMLKRILVDFTLLKQLHKNLNCALFQLESQLGGDYSKLTLPTFGSPSTHTLLSYFDVDLHIITLLEGERKVDRPIHKKEFYKPLKKERVQYALNYFKDILRKYN